jgi:hypothetical protein
MKKIVVISNFFLETENSRSNLAYKYFKEKGYDTKLICSDFSHATKKKQYYKNGNEYIVIKTKKYKSNLSPQRIFSHICFAKNVIKELSKIEVDLVYVNIPPNILGYYVAKYCKKNNIKLITDVIDLWPEALPIPIKIKKIFNLTFGKIWKNLRKTTLIESDYILTESDYFCSELNLNKYKKVDVIYLKKMGLERNIHENKNISKNKEKIKIGYLGNIGKIYDFESLIEICTNLKKHVDVELEIIGEGEQKKFLLTELKKYKIKYNFHGIIYEDNLKQEILSQCDFGFNGYKETTEVALSYKTIDYFSYNLPLINSAKGDTWNFVNEYQLGMNYQKNEKMDETIRRIIQLSKDRGIKKRVKDFFDKNFSYESFINEMDEVIARIKK